jgi:hypothetical protein
MIQIFTKLEYEFIVPFQLQLKSLIHVISQKPLDKFFIQANISLLKKTFCWGINFIWKMTKIMLEAFVSKYILYVYQNVTQSFLKTTPKIYPKNKHFLT